jgi:hypothetical protein
MICPEVVEPTTTRARIPSGRGVRISAARLRGAPFWERGGVEAIWPLPFGRLQFAGAPCRTNGLAVSGVRNDTRDTSHRPSLSSPSGEEARRRLPLGGVARIGTRAPSVASASPSGVVADGGRPSTGTFGYIVEVGCELRQGAQRGIRWVVTLERQNATRAPALL